MPPGAAVIYLGSTIHGGGRQHHRRSPPPRHARSYVVGWLRTEENQYLATPARGRAHAAAPRAGAARLGGHDAIAAGGGYLGAVDLRDPVELLAEGSLKLGRFVPPSRESFQRTL